MQWTSQKPSQWLQRHRRLAWFGSTPAQGLFLLVNLQKIERQNVFPVKYICCSSLPPCWEGASCLLGQPLILSFQEGRTLDQQEVGGRRSQERSQDLLEEQILQEKEATVTKLLQEAKIISQESDQVQVHSIGKRLKTIWWIYSVRGGRYPQFPNFFYQKMGNFWSNKHYFQPF